MQEQNNDQTQEKNKLLARVKQCAGLSILFSVLAFLFLTYAYLTTTTVEIKAYVDQSTAIYALLLTCASIGQSVPLAYYLHKYMKVDKQKEKK